jgi:hypothetical protein
VIPSWAIAGLAAVIIAVGGFSAGWRVNGWRIDAAQKKADDVEQRATAAATTAAVDAIKNLRPQFTTINKGVERETRTEVRYTGPDCSHTPTAWGLLDSAYQAAGGQPFAGRTSLPTPATAAGSDVRSDH